jgi:hypothetical protein
VDIKIKKLKRIEIACNFVNTNIRHNTMQLLIIAIAIFLAFSSSAQTEKFKIFKKTEYSNNNFYTQTYDTIKLTQEPIDIYFFRKHFHFPYYLPDKFIDERLKHRTTSVWRDPNGKKDDKNNWQNTYTYDSLGRVTSYTYSGCFVCSNFPYNYRVTYNKKGQVEQLNETINSIESFKFYYDNKGDIIKLEKYLLDKLETEVVN